MTTQLLPRTQSNWKIRTLLVRMQNDTATLDNSCLAALHIGMYPSGMKTYLHTEICTLMFICQKLQTTQISVPRRMDTQSVVPPYKHIPGSSTRCGQLTQTVLVNFKCIVQRESSQTQRAACDMIPYT